MTETTSAEHAQPMNLATMAIADKVSRYVHARFYQAHLDALQAEVQRCGGFFACHKYPEYLPPDFREHLALAVMVAKNAYLAPSDSLAQHYAEALRRLADGSAHTLLRDLLAGLGALGLHFQIRPEGLDREGIKAQRLEWGMAACSSKELPTLDRRASKAAVDGFVGSFFSALARHGHDET